MDWHFVFKVKDGEVFRMCPPSSNNTATTSATATTTSTGRPKRFHCAPHNIATSDTDAAKESERMLKVQFRDKLKKSQNCQKPLDLGLLHLPEKSNPTKVVSVGEDGAIDLGNSGLMLNIITPLQKFSKGGTTISDVIRQRFQDLFQREISSDALKEVEDVFTKKKEDRMKLQQVRLLVEVFTCEDLPGGASAPDVPASQNLVFKSSGLSEVITNSKSKECGPLQLHDVNPNISCCKSETKIFILSFFKVCQN